MYLWLCWVFIAVRGLSLAAVNGGYSAVMQGLLLWWLLLLQGAFLVAQTVKNLPAMHETWVRSVGWEDPLEKGLATHCSILAWRIPWREQP